MAINPRSFYGSRTPLGPLWRPIPLGCILLASAVGWPSSLDAAIPIPQSTGEAKPTQQESPKKKLNQEAKDTKASETSVADDEPKPVTAEEQQQVTQLLEQLASADYQIRKRAARELTKMDLRFIEVLATLPPPKKVETRIQVARIKDRVGKGGILNFQWTMETRPMEGETLNLDPGDCITFYEDGYFSTGDNHGKPETWTYDQKTKRLRMSYNGDYAIYIGQMDEDGNFVGKAKNIKDKEWYFRLKRIEKNR